MFFNDLGVWFGYIYTLGFVLGWLFSWWLVIYLVVLIYYVYYDILEEEIHDLQIGVSSSDNSDKNLAWRTRLLFAPAFNLLISIHMFFTLTMPFLLQKVILLVPATKFRSKGKDVIKINHAMLY